ncbi:MAG: hypothetical protein K8R69_07835, partial [Deltaproteobacteria bacterium]|nr:hypothetical protein [Deltaproteobacteria bacterium]
LIEHLMLPKNAMNRNEQIIEFRNFLNKEIAAALAELLNIQTDQNRKHLQKLVYANLVDRFDYFLDKFLLSSSDNPILKDMFLKTKEADKVTERKFYEVILSEKETILAGLEEDFKTFIRSEKLKERHARKLEIILESFGMPKKTYLDSRVNSSTGEILSKRKKHKSIPQSLKGYVDWLYCRRNALVHGGNTRELTPTDLKTLNSEYKVDCAKSINITMGSIKTAKKFYLGLVAQIEKFA